MTAGEGGLVGLPVVRDGESPMAQGAGEASVPMEVTRLPISGDLELGSRPSYAQVAARAQTMGLRFPYTGGPGSREHSETRPFPLGGA